MKAADRKRLEILLTVINSVPFPNGHGGDTASAKGIAAYINDMRELKPLLLEALRCIAREGWGDTNTAVKRVDDWLNKRQSEHWR